MAQTQPKKGGILRAYLNFNVLYKILIGLVIGAVAGIHGQIVPLVAQAQIPVPPAVDEVEMIHDLFKQLVEGKNPNGEIDTLPEMLGAAKGISDGETIQEHTGQQIEEELEEEAATNDDIDEMF